VDNCTKGRDSAGQLVEMLTGLVVARRLINTNVSTRQFIAAAVLVLGFGQSINAQDWSQWRGPTRDGLVPASVAPATWPVSLSRAWRVEIGEGYSSPVVSRGLVFVHGRRTLTRLSWQ
jgi:hypothetical protein